MEIRSRRFHGAWPPLYDGEEKKREIKDEPNWSERVEDLVASGDVTAAISFLESLTTKFQSRLCSSSSSSSTDLGLQLAAALKEAVRKKAIMALHRFHRKSPSVSHLISNFRKRLCDNDPGVMGATLCPLFDLINEDVTSYKDLVSSFVSILKQVTERRLPKSYDYHQMPAPFIQIKLLKIMALLGSGDKSASEIMYMVLGDLFRKCDSSTNIGNAILYECIRCISCIIPSPKLLEAAADAISKFLKSDSHNLKYIGIDGLGRLIKISPDIAEQHQLAVIDCLEDPDDTLKRKTFELLYKMTKSSNVEVIVDRMIDYMISINDNHYKTEIASRCVELAEQFAPSNQWFIQIMNKVFEHAGDLVNIKVAHNLMRLIAEGFGEDDDDADSKLRLSAVCCSCPSWTKEASKELVNLAVSRGSMDDITVVIVDLNHYKC